MPKLPNAQTLFKKSCGYFQVLAVISLIVISVQIQISSMLSK
jgi:hypothetical protein